ncbi:MAG: hypothetical protein IKU52_00255 [Clostridia bacterium]|nr:hypothetical protein [Clostridia bacterium]
MFFDSKYKTTGRTILTDEGLMMLSSADSFEFNANCEDRVSIYITAKGENTDVYFTVYIDGERKNPRFHVSEGKNVLVPVTDLKKGEHNIKLVRQTEWDRGDVYITDVEIKGELIDPPKDKEVFIEFVGDSLVSGFGNQPKEYSPIEWGGASAYQDATKAYPFMISQALDCDISVVAIQGIGTSCGGWEFTMNEVYENYPRVNEKDYSYSPKRSADIVVVHLLGNDKYEYENRGFTLDYVFEKAEELCRMVRAKHPNAAVIFCPADFCEKGAKMIEEKLGGAENGYYSTILYMDALGKGAHPSVAGHESAVEALLPLMKDILEKKVK